jgi:hypothetical protein
MLTTLTTFGGRYQFLLRETAAMFPLGLDLKNFAVLCEKPKKNDGQMIIHLSV